MADKSTVDSYILKFPEEIQARLQEVRKLIQQALPGASERISYQMPTFYQTGNVIHYAAWKDHLGIYPGPSGVSEFQDRLQDFDISKGCIRIPFDKQLPEALLTQICLFRARENRDKATARKLLSKSHQSQ